MLSNPPESSFPFFRVAADPVTQRLSSAATAASWLAVMRWHAVGGQAAAIVIASFTMHIALPLPALFACVAALAATNVALVAVARRAPVGSPLLAAVLLFDIGVLTLELGLSGGADNPFAIFYLVQVLLAGLLLPVRWVGAVGVAAGLGYACLFRWPSAIHLPDDQNVGRGVAFVLLALVTGLFTSQTANALRVQHRNVLSKQKLASHASNLASLSTLAAGAAHELGSPLGTITVAAEELDALIAESPEAAIEDARVIREEIGRCREIVHRMNARAGQLMGELPEPTTAGAILEELEASFPLRERKRIVIGGDLYEALECPARGLVRILGNLVANALQASDAAVLVTAELDACRMRFKVEDRGTGIAPEVRAKLGEPFVTTKDPGQGMGLGLFLSFAFAELCAGRLDLSPRKGGGTTAVLELPCKATAPT